MSKEKMVHELLNEHFSEAGKTKANRLILEWNKFGGKPEAGIREISLIKSGKTRLRLASYDVEKEHVVIRQTVSSIVSDSLVTKYHGSLNDKTASIPLAELAAEDLEFIARCCYTNTLIEG